MSCDARELARLSACYCFTSRQQDSVDIYLLAVWSGCNFGNMVLGDPGAPMILGDPTTGLQFGEP